MTGCNSRRRSIGLGFRVWGLGIRVYGFRIRVWGGQLGCKMQALGKASADKPQLAKGCFCVKWDCTRSVSVIGPRGLEGEDPPKP